jgi:hypothetical protein
VGASDLGLNFHHLSSRKLSPSVSNQVYSCEVCQRFHSDKGHRNKAADSEAEVCPLMRASCLAFLSGFQFPQTAVVSPFWCPQQCMAATHLGTHTTFSNFRIFLFIFNSFSELEVLTGNGCVFSDSIQSHYCISDKMCVFLDKAVAICESLNVWMTNGLVGKA